jgi:hypothetical protein
MDKKTRYEQLAAWQVFRVIELCYQQGTSTTWRDIYEFLRIPEYVYETEPDLDEIITIKTDQDLENMRLLLESKFSTRH